MGIWPQNPKTNKQTKKNQNKALTSTNGEDVQGDIQNYKNRTTAQYPAKNSIKSSKKYSKNKNDRGFKNQKTTTEKTKIQINRTRKTLSSRGRKECLKKKEEPKKKCKKKYETKKTQKKNYEKH